MITSIVSVQLAARKEKKRGTWGLPWDYQTQQSHYGYLAYGPYLLSNQTYSCPRKHIGAARIGWYWNYASGYQHIAFVWIKKYTTSIMQTHIVANYFLKIVLRI